MIMMMRGEGDGGFGSSSNSRDPPLSAPNESLMTPLAPIWRSEPRVTAIPINDIPADPLGPLQMGFLFLLLTRGMTRDPEQFEDPLPVPDDVVLQHGRGELGLRGGRLRRGRGQPVARRQPLELRERLPQLQRNCLLFLSDN